MYCVIIASNFRVIRPLLTVFYQNTLIQIITIDELKTNIRRFI